MKRLVIFLLVVLVAVGALGYWRGWFTMGDDGRHVQVDAEKFKKDKEAFTRTVSEKAKAMKGMVANLWKKSKTLTDADKTGAEKELKALEEKHDRIEQQLKDLERTGEQNFQSLKDDLNKAMEDIEKRTGELMKKLHKEWKE